MGIQALSFDADQTLWDYRQVQRLALRSTIGLMEASGVVDAGVVPVDALQGVRAEVVGEFSGRPHSLEEVRERSFELFLSRVGHADPAAMAATLAEHFLAQRFDHIELYPEVSAVIARLKGRYRVGLLTNGNTYPERCGLPDTFDAVVIGPSHGFEKPALIAFETVAAELDVSLSNIAHIGDDWDDIEGANNAGCVSIHIDREDKRPAFAEDADHVVADLTELEALLEGLADG